MVRWTSGGTLFGTPWCRGTPVSRTALRLNAVVCSSLAHHHGDSLSVYFSFPYHHRDSTSLRSPSRRLAIITLTITETHHQFFLFLTIITLTITETHHHREGRCQTELGSHPHQQVDPECGFELVACRLGVVNQPLRGTLHGTTLGMIGIVLEKLACNHKHSLLFYWRKKTLRIIRISLEKLAHAIINNKTINSQTKP